MTNRARASGCAGSNYPFLTQKERDSETGLDYFLARYYSSTQGRFTSPDEFAGGPDSLYSFADDASENPTFYADLTNPQSLNKYQYTYNDPLNFTDSDGHCPLCLIPVAIAVTAYILLSPKTVHGPTHTPTYQEPGHDPAAQMMGLAMGEALGGPIISKVGGKILSRFGGRSAAEAAELQAQRQLIVRLAHMRELGLDPATKGFRAAEAEAGARLEGVISRRLSRETSGAVDFLDKSGRTYDLVGAGLKSQHFDYQAVTDQITSHLGKADRVVVDVHRLSRRQIASVEQFVQGLTREQAARVSILR
ncbi:MAG: RHS repeat-associated core domain-containing protein [Pyrinomonadaceae bacterium]